MMMASTTWSGRDDEDDDDTGIGDQSGHSGVRGEAGAHTDSHRPSLHSTVCLLTS